MASVHGEQASMIFYIIFLYCFYKIQSFITKYFTGIPKVITFLQLRETPWDNDYSFTQNM